ncbi:MAG: TRAP transporter TatT component family protein [Myxococcales bacterium]|nr:TRAP transporter TatT component family protein [Myxococcales bacterium]
MLRHLALTFLLVLSGCATTYNARWLDPAAPATAATTQTDEAKALVEAGDAAWAQREDAAKVREAITKWEAAAQLWTNGDHAARLSRAHYFLGDSFVAVSGDAEARDAEYNASLEWAVKAMKLTAPDTVKDLAAGVPMVTAVKKAPKEASEALLWYASSLGKWAAMRRVGTRLKYKDELKAVIDHVAAIDPSQHGATHRWLATYEAQTINILGGSAERSEEHFKKSLEIAPNYVGTKVLWAQFLCPKTGNRTLAKKLLEEAIAADPTLDAGNVAENKADQQKAKALLANFDALFVL